MRAPSAARPFRFSFKPFGMSSGGRYDGTVHGELRGTQVTVDGTSWPRPQVTIDVQASYLDNGKRSHHVGATVSLTPEQARELAAKLIAHAEYVDAVEADTVASELRAKGGR